MAGEWRQVRSRGDDGGGSEWGNETVQGGERMVTGQKETSGRLRDS